MTSEGFVKALVGYYGPYRGDAAARVVVRWIQSERIGEKALDELYTRTVETIPAMHGNVPDIAQLKQVVRQIASEPKRTTPSALLEDRAEDRKREVADLLAGLVRKLSLRRR